MAKNKAISKETAKEYQRMGVEQRIKNRQEKERMMIEFVSGNFKSYEEFMNQLKQGREIGENQRQFMDRLEKQFEFAFPKRARVDKNGDDVDNKIEIVIKNEYADFKPTVQGDN